MNNSISVSRSSKWEKINTMVVVISPLLALYGLGISTITLLDAVIFICFVSAISVSRRLHLVSINHLNKYIWAIIALIIVNLLGTLIFQTNSQDGIAIILRTMRFVYYLLFVVFCLNEKNFDVGVGIKIYEFITVFSSLYLIVQFFLLYVYGFALPGYLPFLPLMREELETFTTNLTLSDYVRPRSIFGEPSQFGIYACGYLSLSIFYGRKERFTFERWIIIFAMLISASTTAVMGLAAILCVYLGGIFKKKQISYPILGIVIAIILCAFFYMDFITDRLDLLISRMPKSFFGRYNCFFDYYDKMSLFGFRELMFGIGMDWSRVTMWYSGPVKVLLYWGLLGALSLTFVIVLYFIRMRGAQRKTFMIFLLSSMFNEILVSNWLILLLPFVLRNLMKYDKN